MTSDTRIAARTLPYPPLALRERVGATGATSEDDVVRYEEIGAACRGDLLAALPHDWTWIGRRVLDFGCGAGRTLRHFLPESETADFFGADIHEPSIEWLQVFAHPPFRGVICSERPPLVFPDEHFDLVYGLSAFTHIGDGWAEWLLEMRRVVRPGGLVLLTFLGSGLPDEVRGGPWEADRTGMTLVHYGQDQQDVGPSVVHSPWWLRAHWGRAFEILRLEEQGWVAGVAMHGGESAREHTHGWVLMRRPDGPAPSAEELERPEPDEPREFAAVQHALERARIELLEWRGRWFDALPHIRLVDLQLPRLEALEQELEARRRDSETLERIINGRWWRVRQRLVPAIEPARRLQRRLRR